VSILNAIVVSIRFILLILGGQKQVALENAALRQQLGVFTAGCAGRLALKRHRAYFE
jgi:hypothetical protein